MDEKLTPGGQSKVVKSWAENTDQEKIEVLRNVIEDLQRNMGYLSNSISNVDKSVRNLKYHSHAEGKVVIAIDNVNSNSDCGAMVSSASKNPLK